MDKVTIAEPIKIGFPYALEMLWPSTFFAAGETLRADLRPTTNGPRLAAFTVTRSEIDANTTSILLELSAAQTAAFQPAEAQTEPVLVGATRETALEALIRFKIRHHTTKAFAS